MMATDLPRLDFRLFDVAPCGSLDAEGASALRDFGVPAEARIARQPNGKPFIQCGSITAAVGIGISRARVIDGEFAAITMIEQRDIGLDIEPLNQPATNAAFQDSISSPEDLDARRRLTSLGLDDGLGLWCIKEAALKGSGDVLTDPRDLAVRYRNGLWLVQPSLRASAPTPDFDVVLFRLSNAFRCRLLAAIALRAGIGDDTAAMAQKFQDAFRSEMPDWRIASLLDPSFAMD